VATAAGRGPDDVAGKPRPGAFLEAARQAGSSRPLVVGDRLDTDLEGARAAGMHGLLVLTGVTGVTELLAAPAHQRPDYVGFDLHAMLAPQPAAQLVGPAQAECAGAVARIDGGSGSGSGGGSAGGSTGAAVQVLHAGTDPVALLRASAVAAWAHQDVAGHLPLDLTALLAALRAMDGSAGWAR
jgi:glycerol 3-phosphatase-2